MQDSKESMYKKEDKLEHSNKWLVVNILWHIIVDSAKSVVSPCFNINRIVLYWFEIVTEQCSIYQNTANAINPKTRSASSTNIPLRSHSRNIRI